MINSCNKGKTFERTICRMLTEASGVSFIRTANSGAYATIHESSNLEEQRGDITYDHSKYKFFSVIECKHIKKIDVVYDMYRPKSDLRQWIDKLITADAVEGNWLLIVRMNNREILFFTDSFFCYSDTSCMQFEFKDEKKLRVIHAGFFDNLLDDMRKNAETDNS